MTNSYQIEALANAAPMPVMAALAFSIVGALVLGVMCAIAALTQAETRSEGRGEAAVALAISAGWVGLVVALVNWNIG
jgi:hypothetical protein